MSERFGNAQCIVGPKGSRARKTSGGDESIAVSSANGGGASGRPPSANRVSGRSGRGGPHSARELHAQPTRPARARAHFAHPIQFLGAFARRSRCNGRTHRWLGRRGIRRGPHERRLGRRERRRHLGPLLVVPAVRVGGGRHERHQERRDRRGAHHRRRRHFVSLSRAREKFARARRRPRSCTRLPPARERATHARTPVRGSSTGTDRGRDAVTPIGLGLRCG